ncbi:hypothetical protein DICPUDRAFT_42334 [Dictyostelium purpureum]|uniref:mRNA cap guanine-N(7) methyltransferase n=1 Tax=Dictyostelium purpureum TaxID=5786 RepID=F1A1V7_DICPU|nr:uncharacterized protein DICPUDRAFT_42334 [Dictyostelium purpureum]EGC29826.1 hypothetical protein DICPUDRAFT_42334 [Dictyostelium purpureum]|eukprot:XP_003293647.1 hypothetical protein DICPUDRAFT_42334 [Dictyostelium purpureum]
MTSNQNEYNYNNNNSDDESNDLSKINNNGFRFDNSNQQQYLQQFSNFEKHDNFFNNQQQQQQQQQQQYRQQNQQQQQQYRQRQNYTQQNNYNPYRFNNNNNKNDSYIRKQNEIVKSHYDHKQNIPIHIRSKSKIISLKNLNNWVKSILIQEYSKPNTIVFDICGGKLGDLQKWIKAQIKSLVVADISLESLKHGVERYNQALNHIHFDIKMIAVDYYDSFDNNSFLKVDLVSCQFALHYSFRTRESAMQLLKNVSSVLKDGGYFIGTIPNACLIVKKLREAKSNRFGNEVYSIEFKDKEPTFSAFGCAYKFYLEDAIDFLEEYLVHMDVLVEMAKEFQLELVLESNFHDFIYEKSKSHYDLLRKMNCFNQNHTVSQAEWEALGIYKAFVFKKASTHNHSNDQDQQNQPEPNKPQKISEEDIIVHL